MKAFLAIFFLQLIFLVTLGQSSYTGGLQTEIKPTVSFEKGWKLNGKITTRTLLFEGSSEESIRSISVFERSELEMIMTKKVSQENAIGFGYLIRDEEGVFKQRLIQQFSMSKMASTFNYGHRFRFDETFQKDRDVIFRFRYRINFEKDIYTNPAKNKKTYFFAGNEYLPTLEGDDFMMEMRVFPGVGWKLNDKNKIELGLDYRMENLFTKSHAQVFLFNIAWLPSF